MRGSRLLLWTALAVSSAALAGDAMAPTAEPSLAQPRLRGEERTLVVEGKPRLLYAAALPYAETPRELWREQFRRLVAAGFNAVETAIPWSVPASASAESQARDLDEWLSLAEEGFGLFVAIRIGVDGEAAIPPSAGEPVAHPFFPVLVRHQLLRRKVGQGGIVLVRLAPPAGEAPADFLQAMVEQLQRCGLEVPTLRCGLDRALIGGLSATAAPQEWSRDTAKAWEIQLRSGVLGALGDGRSVIVVDGVFGGLPLAPSPVRPGMSPIGLHGGAGAGYGALSRLGSMLRDHGSALAQSVPVETLTTLNVHRDVSAVLRRCEGRHYLFVANANATETRKSPLAIRTPDGTCKTLTYELAPGEGKLFFWDGGTLGQWLPAPTAEPAMRRPDKRLAATPVEPLLLCRRDADTPTPSAKPQAETLPEWTLTSFQDREWQPAKEVPAGAGTVRCRFKFELPEAPAESALPWVAQVGSGLPATAFYLNGHWLGGIRGAKEESRLLLPECWLASGPGAPNVLAAEIPSETWDPAILRDLTIVPCLEFAERRKAGGAAPTPAP